MSIDAEFIEEMRALLLERRAALTRVAATTSEAAATVELDQTRIGRLSRMDAMQSQAMAKEIGRRNQRDLAAIDQTLRRIDEDDYGLCRQGSVFGRPKTENIHPRLPGHCGRRAAPSGSTCGIGSGEKAGKSG